MSDFEAVLRSLSPRPARLDRDRLMFEAGRTDALREAAVNRTPVRGADSQPAPAPGNAADRTPERIDHKQARRLWLWKATTIASACCTIALGVLLIQRPLAERADGHADGAEFGQSTVAGAESRSADASLLDSDAPRPAATGDVPQNDRVVRSTGGAPSTPYWNRLPVGFVGFRFDSRPIDVTYLRLRQVALEQGVDALPMTQAVVVDAGANPPSPTARPRRLRVFDSRSARNGFPTAGSSILSILGESL